MNLLKRELSPITPEAWAEIDAEAARVLKLRLAARKVVDFKGPGGWELAAVNLGRLSRIDPPVDEITSHLRAAQPLVEVRAPFRLSIEELDAASRGAADIDLEPLVRAAERIASVEDRAVFHGYDAAGIQGILPAAVHEPIGYGGPKSFPSVVVGAKEILRKAGIARPYALVLGPTLYDELHSAAEDGFPIYDRIAPMVDAIVWCPALTDAVLLSTRGGDFELTVGQDLSIGYAGCDRESVELFLVSSFTFRVLTPQAAVGVRRG